MVKIADKEVGTADLVIGGAGVLMLIDSFLPWYGVNFGKAFGVEIGSINIKGWSSGFWAWAGILLVLAAATLVAVRVFAGQVVQVAGRVGPALLVLALSGLGTLFFLIRLLSESHYTKFGLYLGIIIGAAQTAYAFLAFRASGEQLPTAGGSPQPSA